MPIKKFTVKHGNKEVQVFIPETGDKSYDDYLEVAEREKTLDQLKKKPDKPKSKLSKKDKVEAIKEIKAYGEDKKTRTNPKYFSGDYTS